MKKEQILRHYNTIKKAYFRAYKECIKYPDFEARIFLKSNGMPFVRYYPQGDNSWMTDEYDMYHLCTVNTMYWDYANEDMYKDGKPKVCKILRECAWDIERELDAYIDNMIERYCE